MATNNNRRFDILARLDQNPPFFVFYLARRRVSTVSNTNARKKKKHRTTRMTRPSIEEISQLSGIPQRTLVRIASAISWEGVRVGLIDPFLKACRVDIFKTSNLRNYLRHTLTCDKPFAHLNPPQMKRFNLLCARWRMVQEQKKEPATSAAQLD